MSGPVRTALADVNERAPHLPLPTGICDRAGKRRRRQRILGAIAAVTVVLGAGAAMSIVGPGAAVAPSQASAIDDMPARVVNAPKWTASIEDAPLPRALVAFTEHPGGDVTLVGPDDRYRRYKASGDGRPVLSPDGRFLMTGRGLLDVTTGVTRSLKGDAPLAFSPDSRLALLARYDSDIEVRGEIRAVDPVSGEFVWAIRLEPGPLPRDITVAVAPDGSLTAIQRHAELWLYDADGRLLWIRPFNGDLAGQKAFLLEWRSVASASLFFIDPSATENGVGGLCHDMTDFPRSSSGGPVEILGWEAGFPIVNLSRDVVSLQGVPTKLLEGPQHLAFIGFASERVRWSKREPGPPDAGPFVDRYRPILNVAGGALLIIVLLVAIRATRARGSRRWGTRARS